MLATLFYQSLMPFSLSTVLFLRLFFQAAFLFLGRFVMGKLSNVFAVINMIQLANKLMSRQKAGTIINISSIVGVEGAAGQLVYSASKGAVAAMTKAAAKEFAPNGIRVNAVAPGLINTGLLQAIGDEKIAENLKNVKMGRLGEPLDVANVILFLASDLSGYVTGEIIGIDGEAQV